MLLALVVLLVFGPKRLPEIGRNLGRGMRDFKGALTGEPDEGHASLSPPGAEADRTGDAEPRNIGDPLS